MTGIREWLQEQVTCDMVEADTPRKRAEAFAKLEILSFHEQWPTLVERSMPEIAPMGDFDVNKMAYRMSRQIAWKTEQEYIARFGTEPPTTPILRALARVYFDRPGFQDEWL